MTMCPIPEKLRTRAEAMAARAATAARRKRRAAMHPERGRGQERRGGTGGQCGGPERGQPGDGGASAGSDQPGEKGDGDAPGAGEGQGEGEGEFEARLKDFVAKHGEDARKLNEGDSGARAASGEGEGGNGESSGTSGAAAERKEARARSNEEEDIPPTAPMNATDRKTPADSQNPEKPEPPEAAEKDNPDSQPAEKSREPAGPRNRQSFHLPRRNRAREPAGISAVQTNPKPEGKDQNAGQNSDQAGWRGDRGERRGPAEPGRARPDHQARGHGPERPDSPAVVEMPPDPAPPEPAQDGANPAPEEGEMRGSPAADKRAERVDVLDMLARGEPPREEDLIALGWPEARRLEFMKDFERLRNSARKAGVIGPTGEWRGQALYGADDVARGEKRGENVGEKVDRGVSLDDGLSQIARPPDAAVPTSLRPVLDAYYRALAKRRTASSQPVHD